MTALIQHLPQPIVRPPLKEQGSDALSPTEKIKLSSQEIAREVLFPSFAELGISLAVGAAAISFTAAPFGVPLIFGAIAIQTLCNTTFRYYQTIETKSQHPSQIASLYRHIYPTTFSYLTAGHFHVLTHECGHALAAKLAFQNACPSIEFYPFQGGLTKFSISKLTPFGQMLGKTRALCFTALMGPAGSLCLSLLIILVGYAVQHRFPQLSFYLLIIGRGNFISHSWYAFTALNPSNTPSSHDFRFLAAHGLNPLAAAIAILAIPIFLHFAQSSFHKISASPDKPQAVICVSKEKDSFPGKIT